MFSGFPTRSDTNRAADLHLVLAYAKGRFSHDAANFMNNKQKCFTMTEDKLIILHRLMCTFVFLHDS